MWEKPSHRTATGIARPLRVAYLVDLADCPDELLDTIFAEAYSRWGGRRTLIVPAIPQGIDERYYEWLKYFDPDIIYSFVALSDAAVETLHERYGPAYLTRHQGPYIRQSGSRSFEIRLPFDGLPSLSVLPAFLARNWGFDGRPANLTVLNKHRDLSESRFLEENFGFLSKSFSGGAFTRSFPELFTSLTLIASKSLADPHQGKDKHAIYVEDEDKILELLGQRNWLLPLVNLSEMFAPYLDTGLSIGHDGMNIVVGDTPADRLLFWNGHHRFARPRFQAITSLRIPVDRFREPAFIKRLREIINHRGVDRGNGQNDAVALRSCSLDQATLEAAADGLRTAGRWLAVNVEGNLDHAWCVPRFRDERHVYFTQGGGVFDEPGGRAFGDVRGNQVVVPRATPWHMSESLPPAGLRQGNWMVDLTIERLVDHCRYANQRHVWAIPRRLRLERAFRLDREPDRPLNLDQKFIRPTRTGELGLALSVDLQAAVLTTPEDDLSALQIGICNDSEWVAFDHGRQGSPNGRLRFWHSEVSDKGRYLLGVLQLFNSVPSAFGVLMDGFWRDVLQLFGASPSESSLELAGRFITTLRRRLNQPTGALTIESEEQLHRMAFEAIRIGRMLRRERRYISYSKLKLQWLAIVQKFLSENPKPAGDDDEVFYKDESNLDQSIQYLCQCEVLFQGREWQCRSCYNRNWVSIEAVGRTMTCEVCGRDVPAPVSGDWHFRLNPFLLDAYREHGTEALVWALWQLSERAQKSFYFAPSLKLWTTRPVTDHQQCDVEIDAVAVIDGHIHVIEATMAETLTDDEIAQLAVAAERVRPDTLLVACMAKTTKVTTELTERLRARLPNGVLTEVLVFDPDKLDRCPILPH